MSEKVLWNDMLDVLKDIQGYLRKQDSTQARTTLADTQTAGEDQKPITGGEMPSGYGPGKGFAKQLRKGFGDEAQGGMPPVPPEESEEDEYDDEEEGGEEEEMGREEEEMGEEEESMGREEEGDRFNNELKSLLKDIKSALVAKSSPVLTKEMKSEIQKSVHKESEYLLRKMGFHPARPDIVKFGLNDPLDRPANVTKSKEKSALKDEVLKEEDLVKAIDTMSGKSWGELAAMREKMGHFNPFK